MEEEYVTIGGIAKKLEDESYLKSDNGKPEFSYRTIERNFLKLAKYLEVDVKIFKDERNRYSFEKDNEALLEVFLLELAKPNSFIKNIIEGKEHKTETQDIIDTYKRCKEHIEMKDDKGEYRFKLEVQYYTLGILDHMLHYNFTLAILEVEKNILKFRESIYDFSYGEQVILMNQLNQELNFINSLDKKNILEDIFKKNEKLAKIIKAEGNSKYFSN